MHTLLLPSLAHTLSVTGGCQSRRGAGGKLERGEGGTLPGATQLPGEDHGPLLGRPRELGRLGKERPDSYWFPYELWASRQVRRASVWFIPAL